jgi:glutathione S-transferase
MLTLFHHPFCPHSRFVRLAVEELGLASRLVEERVWDRREEFLILNPAGTTPVLVEEGMPPVPGAAIIAEYLDETRGAKLAQPRLMPRDAGPRVEVRRLMSWFNDKFFEEVSARWSWSASTSVLSARRRRRTARYRDDAGGAQQH